MTVTRQSSSATRRLYSPAPHPEETHAHPNPPAHQRGSPSGRLAAAGRLAHRPGPLAPGRLAPGDPAARIRDPDLEVCVYHDARLAEVRSFRGFQRHRQLSRLQSGLKRELDQRWARNMMLNKWLEYCVERGHRFSSRPESGTGA